MYQPRQTDIYMYVSAPIMHTYAYYISTYMH